MKFNVQKCQHITFCSQQVQINSRYMICNGIIKQVDSIKYLGVIIDKKTTWSQQVDKITLKANRVSGFLYRNIKHCSLDVKKRYYKIFVRLINTHIIGMYVFDTYMLKFTMYQYIAIPACSYADYTIL